MWHKLCCYNFEIISNIVNEEPSITCLFTWSSHAKQWEYDFHVSFQELLRILHLLHFQELISSSCCYTFASHACNLGSHTTFFLSFDSFQVTIQHATIVVHENCWDNFKKLPQTSLLLCDAQVAHESSQKLFLPCRIWMAQVPKSFPTCGIKL